MAVRRAQGQDRSLGAHRSFFAAAVGIWALAATRDAGAQISITITEPLQGAVVTAEALPVAATINFTSPLTAVTATVGTTSAPLGYESPDCSHWTGTLGLPGLAVLQQEQEPATAPDADGLA